MRFIIADTRLSSESALGLGHGLGHDLLTLDGVDKWMNLIVEGENSVFPN